MRLKRCMAYGVFKCGALWVSLAFAHMQGEEMGDCWRHVPAYLQVGAGDGAQIRWCESFLCRLVYFRITFIPQSEPEGRFSVLKTFNGTSHHIQNHTLLRLGSHGRVRNAPVFHLNTVFSPAFAEEQEQEEGQRWEVRLRVDDSREQLLSRHDGYARLVKESLHDEFDTNLISRSPTGENWAKSQEPTSFYQKLLKFHPFFFLTVKLLHTTRQVSWFAAFSQQKFFRTFSNPNSLLRWPVLGNGIHNASAKQKKTTSRI